MVIDVLKDLSIIATGHTKANGITGFTKGLTK